MTSSEFGLICDNRVLLSLPDSFYMIGQVTGSLLGSPLVDFFGRRKNAIANMFGMAVSMLATLGSPNVHVFSVIRIFQGHFSAACYNSVYCLFVEYLPSSKRSMIIPLLGKVNFGQLCFFKFLPGNK